MSQPTQTTETVRADFDRIALLPDEGWDNNARYHRYLLNQIPARCGRALEVGCGTGEFTRLLAARSGRVLAVDLSPHMIRVARGRSKLQANVEFVNADVMACELPAGHFDCVATLTTLHHLPAEPALRRMSEALRPGGVFVCLDLYRRSGLSDLLLDAAALPADVLLRFLKTGRARPPRRVREAYAEHGRTDSYLTLAEVARACARVMPGAQVRRHLFWRYSIVWKKADA
jgi:ubiquinone/menaquinone biosynthesis C-methylase UbiE